MGKEILELRYRPVNAKDEIDLEVNNGLQSLFM